MPKIISHTPLWLSRPSPGFHLFSPKRGTDRGSHQFANGSKNKRTRVGHVKTIARRGSEVFVAVDNEIRWSDLRMLERDWEHREKECSSKRDPIGVEAAKGTPEDWRVLKYPVGEPIQQLSVSPNGSFLAISTSHTVHVVLLPDSSHLRKVHPDPIKLKGNNIGPTIHVLSQSRVVRALWHPFGVSGTCLVTITAEAVVRIWELDRDNRWSFDSPSLAIDLKKLVLGTSEEENFTPEKMGRNKGFSSNAVGMEVVSACFGGTGSEAEAPWSAMTLWIGMQGGDLYALCPLLPTKWAPSENVIPSLSIAAVSRAALQEEVPADFEESRPQRDQYQWLSDIDKQEAKVIQGPPLASEGVAVYSRPLHPGPIPRLQGPFQIFPEDSEQDLELSDLYVIAAKSDRELIDEENSDSELETWDEEGLSATVICLITKSGSVHVCFDLEGVEGEWLPQEKLSHALSPQDTSLVPFEILETLHQNHSDEEWPTFTPDPRSPHSFFVTHSQGVYFFSMDPWLNSLEDELQSGSNTGSTFRINVLKKGPETLRERLLCFEQESHYNRLGSVTACVVFDDLDIGYFMLTSIDGQPQAVILDKQECPEAVPLEEEYEYGPERSDLNNRTLRPAYEPPASLWKELSLPTFVNKQVPPRHRLLLKEEIRLSAATLGVMTKAHRIVSEETHELGVATADLFRRCARLQEELREQIDRVNDAAYRIEGLHGKNADDYRVEGEKEKRREKGRAGLVKRYEDAKERQKELVGRYEKLSGQVTTLGGRSLGEKEEQWMRELYQTRDSLFRPETAKDDEDSSGEEYSEPWKRFDEAKRLARDLVSRALDVRGESPPSDESEDSDRSLRVPSGLRKAKVDQVMDLLARETALVDAAKSRLERLSISSV